MTLTFVQRKILLQLWDNSFPSADMLRRKRVMAPVHKLIELGYLETDPDEEEEPTAFFLTEKGKEAINVE